MASIRAFLNGRGFFETSDLVTIGLFSAMTKASTLILALAGGGMNPVTLLLRSAVHAALLMVLLAKVPKTGVLTLFNIVGSLLAFFLMGQAMLALPTIIVGTLAVELLVRALGGLEKHPGLGILAVAASELFSRAANIGLAYLGVREQPGLLVMVVVISAFSYLGILIGLAGGIRMIKELRHAGLIV